MRLSRVWLITRNVLFWWKRLERLHFPIVCQLDVFYKGSWYQNINLNRNQNSKQQHALMAPVNLYQNQHSLNSLAQGYWSLLLFLFSFSSFNASFQDSCSVFQSPDSLMEIICLWEHTVPMWSSEASCISFPGISEKQLFVGLEGTSGCYSARKSMHRTECLKDLSLRERAKERKTSPVNLWTSSIHSFFLFTQHLLKVYCELALCPEPKIPR